MRYGVHLAASGPQATPERVGRLAARAEALGFDSVWVSDPVIIPAEWASEYPYGPPGTFTLASSRNYYEPLITLAWVAGATQRVRLGVSVLVVPYRNPVVTAKQLATIDSLSGGRLILGIGVGWLQEEFEALGNP
jgi:alkanesulfonate monooxygenase SsuD/methylene tetrahydromethanopterin reductase-like flavin-dependent oxidoreductase (luciferase family)